MTYGGIVRRVLASGRDGALANVVLGRPTLADYIADNTPFFGAIIGRCANRIANATFTLDGVVHHVDANDGPNSLHGGAIGFDKRVWEASVVSPGRDAVALRLRCTSPDGEMGYPGTVSVDVTYTLSDERSLRLDYRASTDAPTIVNLTQHTYWNLAGEGSGAVYDHVLTLNAGRYTPVDSMLLPTGEIAPVEGTPFDFTRSTEIGARIRDGVDQLAVAHGYDHNFVLDRPDSNSLAPAASVSEPTSGRRLDVYTTEPGIQLYTGNHLDGSLRGTSGKLVRQGDGFTLETQHFPDAPNHPSFPSIVLRPGRAYESTTVYRLPLEGTKVEPRPVS